MINRFYMRKIFNPGALSFFEGIQITLSHWKISLNLSKNHLMSPRGLFNVNGVISFLPTDNQQGPKGAIMYVGPITIIHILFLASKYTAQSRIDCITVSVMRICNIF